MAKNSAEPWTVLRLLNWTRDHFIKAGLDDPRLSAEVLLAHVLRWQRIELYTRFNYAPTPDEVAAFRDLIRRAAAFEPIAYLTGSKEFYSLRFKITPDVLVPRPETELLVSQAVEHLRKLGRPSRMWDVCTGSGCVAVATAVHVPDVRALATDISPQAVAVAAENAAAHNVAPRVRCRAANLLNLPEDCRDMAPFDTITCNPPYVADNQMVTQTVRHEPPVAIHGGADGLDFIRPIIAKAGKFLAAGGILAMEFGFTQADAVRDLAVAAGCFHEPKILRDCQGIERAMTTLKK